MTSPGLDYGNHVLMAQWDHEAELDADEERRAEMAIENERAEFRDAAHSWIWRQEHEHG